jgi:hypothetical protein
MRIREVLYRREVTRGHSMKVLLALLLSPSLASAYCSCEFDTSGYKGFGTRAACNVVMSDNDKTCNIAFAAIGASAPVVSSVVPNAGANYEKRAYQITLHYLEYVNKNDQASLVEPKFMQEALLAFARAAYLRPGVTDDLKGLDAAVSQFIRTQAPKISDIFNGKAGHFDGRQGNLTYSVTRTTVRLTYPVSGKKAVTIETTYMPLPEK